MTHASVDLVMGRFYVHASINVSIFCLVWLTVRDSVLRIHPVWLHPIFFCRKEGLETNFLWRNPESNRPLLYKSYVEKPLAKVLFFWHFTVWCNVSTIYKWSWWLLVRNSIRVLLGKDVATRKWQSSLRELWYQRRPHQSRGNIEFHAYSIIKFASIFIRMMTAFSCVL